MADKTDPESLKDTQRLDCPQADATERQCLWILCWLVVIAVAATAGLITVGGCR
jgi:hypothetical protein